MAVEIRVPRTQVSGRLLDSSLTDDDRRFLMDAVTVRGPRLYHFRDSARIRELLQIPPVAPVAPKEQSQ